MSRSSSAVPAEIDRLRAQAIERDPDTLLAYGFKAYSQNDEDGIIAEIFRRVGVTNRVFVEIGVGNGLENNTLLLLFDGWTGLWIDCGEANVAAIRKGFAKTLESGQLVFADAAVDVENVNAVVSEHIKDSKIDLLSIDIDGNDYHVLKALTVVRPRVIVAEYNPRFPPPVEYCMAYDRNHRWRQDDNYGASLKFLESRLTEYRLVGCNITGSNAFFVREGLEASFTEPFSAERHFQPCRFDLCRMQMGHSPAYATLENRVLPTESS